jgi:hypothetical protein
MAGNKDVRKWEQVLERYLAEDNPQQKKNLMFGLAQAQNSPRPPSPAQKRMCREIFKALYGVSMDESRND